MARTSTTTTGVTTEDLGVLLVAAFRYALGRKSYMPTLIADAIRRHWEDIPERDRLLIATELTRALRENDEKTPGRELGWDCDVDTWRKLAGDVVDL